MSSALWDHWNSKNRPVLRLMMVTGSGKATGVTLESSADTGQIHSFLLIRAISTPEYFFHSNNKLVWEIPRCRICIFESQISTINYSPRPKKKKRRWDTAGSGLFSLQILPSSWKLHHSLIVCWQHPNTIDFLKKAFYLTKCFSSPLQPPPNALTIYYIDFEQRLAYRDYSVVVDWWQ